MQYSGCVVTETATIGLYIPDNTMCFRPPARANSHMALFQDANGVVAIYTCHIGYYFASGGTIRTVVCVDNTWSHEIPGCERESFSAIDAVIISSMSLCHCVIALERTSSLIVSVQS